MKNKANRIKAIQQQKKASDWEARGGLWEILTLDLFRVKEAL